MDACGTIKDMAAPVKRPVSEPWRRRGQFEGVRTVEEEDTHPETSLELGCERREQRTVLQREHRTHLRWHAHRAQLHVTHVPLTDEVPVFLWHATAAKVNGPADQADEGRGTECDEDDVGGLRGHCLTRWGCGSKWGKADRAASETGGIRPSNWDRQMPDHQNPILVGAPGSWEQPFVSARGGEVTSRGP